MENRIIILVVIVITGFVSGVNFAGADCGTCSELSRTKCEQDAKIKCELNKKSVSFDSKTGQGQSDGERQIRGLFEQITFLNLINGLNLTEAQVKSIIRINEKAREKASIFQQEQSPLVSEVVAAYGELKNTLEKNQGIPPEVERLAFMMEQKLKTGRQGLIDEGSGLEKEIAQVLTEAQMEIVNTFEPCLIPPKNLKNPVRAGQANDDEMGLKFLARLREMSNEVFEEKIDFIIKKHLDQVKKHVGKLSEEEYQAEGERLYELAVKAREMSDVDFELNSSELAAQIKPPIKEKELRAELHKIEQSRGKTLGRVGRYLLKPEVVISLLEKRLELMVNQPQLEPKNLDEINVDLEKKQSAKRKF